MNITLKRVSGDFHLAGTNTEGLSTEFDASPAIGGTNKAPRPMETVLMALGSCSAIDVISILKKQRQSLDDILIRIQAKREENIEPSLFKTIKIHFDLWGELDIKKVERALSLSIEKYCSVGMTLKKAGAEITYDYTIHPSATH